MESTMLQIRPGHLDAFSEVARQDFENRMVVHVLEAFPSVCEPLGESGVRENILHGIERATAYGIVNEYDICRYVDLMFVFGGDFDRDPNFPWAAKILGGTSLDATGKVDALSTAAQSYLEGAASTVAVSELP
jgi:hypothetical protein